MKLSRQEHAAEKPDGLKDLGARAALCRAMSHAKRQGCAAFGEDPLDAPGAA
jgi:hypothetical protein